MEVMLAKVGGGEAVTNDTEEVAVAEEEVQEVEEGINEENKTEEALDEAPGDENPPEEGDNASFLYLVVYFANPLLGQFVFFNNILISYLDKEEIILCGYQVKASPYRGIYFFLLNLLNILNYSQ